MTIHLPLSLSSLPQPPPPPTRVHAHIYMHTQTHTQQKHTGSHQVTLKFTEVTCLSLLWSARNKSIHCHTWLQFFNFQDLIKEAMNTRFHCIKAHNQDTGLFKPGVSMLHPHKVFLPWDVSTNPRLLWANRKLERLVQLCSKFLPLLTSS